MEWWLANVSVSRKHAAIRRSETGYTTEAISESNIVLIDGQPAEGRTELAEGTEIQLGRFLLVFCMLSEVKPAYLREKARFFEGLCQDCGWSGRLSTLVEEPVCPACNGTAFEIEDGSGAEETEAPKRRATGSLRPMGLGGPSASVHDAATAALTPEDIQRYHARLQEAKKASLERIEEPDEALGMVFELSEKEGCTIGRPGRAKVGVRGFCLGRPHEISWDRDGYKIVKGGPFPSIDVNGTAVKSTKLTRGDVIRVGRSSFRFLVG